MKNKKYSILYSSLTGNTKVLADAIHGALPQDECEYFGVSKIRYRAVRKKGSLCRTSCTISMQIHYVCIRVLIFITQTSHIKMCLCTLKIQ